MGGYIRDLSGQVFGRLTVLEKISPNGAAKYRCKCSCGNETVVYGANLLKGHTSSCGCIKSKPAVNFEDLTGTQSGHLYAEGISRRENGKVYYRCRCDCGKTIEVIARSLKANVTKSCGCRRGELISKSLQSHGGSGSRLFRVWTGMKTRCYNKNEKRYANYGARGIVVCDEWRKSFEAFRDWALANGYDENAPYGECTLDRIDVNGNYCPENCRWATMYQQANNMTSNHLIEYHGERHTISEWSTILNIPKYIISTGLRSGKNFSDIVESKHRRVTFLTFQGETLPITAWERRMGFGQKTISRRLKRGWSVEAALLTPTGRNTK